MPSITFLETNGTRREVDVAVGLTLMEVARDNGVDGVAAECGGACACATCHVYIAPEFADRLPAKADLEAEMLEFAFDVTENSRLSCQLQVTGDFDGMIVRVP